MGRGKIVLIILFFLVIIVLPINLSATMSTTIEGVVYDKETEKPKKKHGKDKRKDQKRILNNKKGCKVNFKRIKWKFKMKGAFDSRVVVHKDIIYFTSRDKYFYALNSKTGKLVWKYKSGGSGYDSVPIISEGIIYMGSCNVYAFDLKGMKKIWEHEMRYESRIIGIRGNNLYVLGDGKVFVLDKRTGRKIWTYPEEGVNYAAIYKDMLFVSISISSGDFFAYDLKNRKMKWKFEVYEVEKVKKRNSCRGYSCSIGTTPVFWEGKVYVGSLNNNIYVLKAETGEFIWKYKVDSSVDSIIAKDGFIYMGSKLGYIYSLNAETGKLMWKIKNGNWDIDLSFVCDNKLYYGGQDDGYIYIYDVKTGKELLKYRVSKRGISSRLMVYEGVMYFGSWDNYIYAVE